MTVTSAASVHPPAAADARRAAAAPAPVPVPVPVPEPVPVDDQDVLFDAVIARLRLGVAGQAAPAVVSKAVLDCAQALEQLHADCVRDRLCAENLRRELLETHGALAAAQLELVGTRADERRARRQADHDSLTSLPNRSSFSARLDDALAPDRRSAPALAVLFLDLDDFKPINDRHGHATGDELLRIVAHRLMRSVRAGDMVCRLGGDEFACMLTAPMGREQLGHVACKLFDAVSAPLQIGALQLSVRPSIGIAVCPTDGDTAAALLESADSAMYRAKRQRMGYAFFDGQTDD